MPRPGFVLDVDKSTPPILFHHGEGFRLEKLPAGRSRVIYPGEPLEPLDDVEAEISHALHHPLDMDPLPALLQPGMKLTIAFDDISLPLPPMKRPDIRQRVIEQVLDLAAAAGVDDVHLIAALALHRRMTEAELREAVGDRVYDAFAPTGALYNHDAEDPDNLAFLGTTKHGEEVEINKRAAESDLLIYVNINIVSMDGGHKSTATGLASYRSIKHHHNVRTMEHSKSFMDRHNSELHHSNWRMGAVIADAGVKVFQIETTINTDTFGQDGPMSVLAKREWEWTTRDRVSFIGMQQGLKRLSSPTRPQDLPEPPGPLRRHLGHRRRHRTGAREARCSTASTSTSSRSTGQTDILTMGLPYICPYNVNSIMNPILVMCLGLGYFFNMYRNKPLVREGWRADHDPPHAVGVPPRPPPELHRLLRAGARRHHRPQGDRGEVGEAVRRRRVVPPPLPDQLRLPRRPPVLHVVLGQPRPGAPGPGHHRRRRRPRREAPRLQGRLHPAGRPRDGRGRRRPPPHHHPPTRTRPSSWPT
jgi:hypothetical protein